MVSTPVTFLTWKRGLDPMDWAEVEDASLYFPFLPVVEVNPSSVLMREGVKLISSSSMSMESTPPPPPEALFIKAVEACNSMAFLPCPSAGGQE